MNGTSRRFLRACPTSPLSRSEHGRINSATGFNIVDNGLCEFIDDVRERLFRQVMRAG